MKRCLSALSLLLVATMAMAQGVKNEVYDELVNVGLQIPDGPKVKLPAPLLKPGQTPKIDTKLLEKAAGKAEVDLFLKRSITAPISLEMDSIEKGDVRCAQMITLRFVAYGKLAALVEGDVFKQLLGGRQKAGQGAEAKAAALTPEQLHARGIRLLDRPDAKETYATMSMSILDKVQVEGVTRNLRTTTPHSALYATRLDERFLKDKEFPNHWRFIADDGQSHPYSGLGGYVLVSALPEPKDALLIEMCYVLHEPTVWFDGRNVIRAKLSIPIQENVRSFRRRLP